MKSAVIFYHKNILSLYQREWIDQCVGSIRQQTHTDYDVLELNYGGGSEKFTSGIFFSIKLKSHIQAMNFLITYAFASGYDVVFNTNMDDHYDRTRFEKQIEKIKQGYHLVSSNFTYFGEKQKQMDMAGYGDIRANLMKSHNVIAHPCVAMHRNFWDEDLHYQELLGYEDLDLWQRAIKKGKKFFILPDYLLHYRIHKSQVTKSYDNHGRKKN